MRCLLAVALITLSPGPAVAQAADLLRLSETLGRAHALRVVCKGRGDQEWRDFMREVLVLEAGEDNDARNRLVDAFNSGFRAFQSDAIGCPENADELEAGIAAEGRALAERMAGRYLD